MAKKAKSFAVDEEIYEAVFSMFKQNYVDVNISYCVNKYLKELLSYLRAMEGALKELPEFDVPMSFIIDSVAREPIFKSLNSTPGAGMTESTVRLEIKEHQRRYDMEVKKYPGQAAKYDISAIDDNVPNAQVIKYIIKTAYEVFKSGGKFPDDRAVEIAREIGDKNLQKKLREKVVPALDRIDPDVKDIVNKFKRRSKSKDNNNQ
jgi:hypothetical protein